MLGTARACASRNCVLQDITRNDENKEEEINWTTVFIIVSTMFCDYFLGTVVIPSKTMKRVTDYSDFVLTDNCFLFVCLLFCSISTTLSK